MSPPLSPETSVGQCLSECLGQSPAHRIGTQAVPSESPNTPRPPECSLGGGTGCDSAVPDQPGGDNLCRGSWLMFVGVSGCRALV